MTFLNPSIDYDGLPRFSAIDPDHVGSAVIADTPSLRVAHMQTQPIMAAYTTAVGQDRGCSTRSGHFRAMR